MRRQSEVEANAASSRMLDKQVRSRHSVRRPGRGRLSRAVITTDGWQQSCAANCRHQLDETVRSRAVETYSQVQWRYDSLFLDRLDLDSFLREQAWAKYTLAQVVRIAAIGNSVQDWRLREVICGTVRRWHARRPGPCCRSRGPRFRLCDPHSGPCCLRIGPHSEPRHRSALFRS